MIEAYIGLPGQGKTLASVHRVCYLLSTGKRVFSNVDITDYVYGSMRSTEKFTGFQDFLDLHDCTFFLDEANIILDSRSFMNTPKEVLHKLAQSRKYGLDLIYTTQGFKHSESRLRQLTNYVWDSHNLKLFRKNYFRYDLYDPEDFEMKTPKGLRNKLSYYILMPFGIYKPTFQFMFSKNFIERIYKSYDTLQIIKNVGLQEGGQSGRYNKISDTKFNLAGQ